jgi:hypothetical protein
MLFFALHFDEYFISPLQKRIRNIKKEEEKNVQTEEIEHYELTIK